MREAEGGNALEEKKEERKCKVKLKVLRLRIFVCPFGANSGKFVLKRRILDTHTSQHRLMLQYDVINEN